jgi:DNA-binding NarL/FixJ family response regulator
VPEHPVAATRPARVAVVNDFDLVLRGLEAMLTPYRDEIVVVERDLRQDPDQRVDVALFDPYGQPGGGVERVRELAADPNVGAVVVYAWHLTPAQADAARDAGARAVLDKALAGPQLAHAISAIANGEAVPEAAERAGFGDAAWPGTNFGLTVRESEVASLLLGGLSNREIADALYISEHTVKTHLKAIFNKTEARSRGQAVARLATDRDFRRSAGDSRPGSHAM